MEITLKKSYQIITIKQTNIKNYTNSAPQKKSLHQVTQLLHYSGSGNIQRPKDYGTTKLVEIRFEFIQPVFQHTASSHTR